MHHSCREVERSGVEQRPTQTRRKVSGRTQESSAGAASAARLSPVQAPGQLNQERTAGALGFSHTGLLVGCFAQYIKFLCTFW